MFGGALKSVGGRWLCFFGAAGDELVLEVAVLLTLEEVGAAPGLALEELELDAILVAAIPSFPFTPPILWGSISFCFPFPFPSTILLPPCCAPSRLLRCLGGFRGGAFGIVVRAV